MHWPQLQVESQGSSVSQTKSVFLQPIDWQYAPQAARWFVQVQTGMATLEGASKKLTAPTRARAQSSNRVFFITSSLVSVSRGG
jgi:hypothetical protein